MDGESQAAETTTTETPAAEPAQSNESAAPLSDSGAINAHLQHLQPKETDTDTGETGKETNENKEVIEDKPTDKKKEVEQKEIEIDSDTQTFLEENKIDLGDLTANETAMNLVKQLQDSKAENTKIVNQQKMTDVALAHKRANQAADNILESEKGDIEPPLPPVKQAEADFNDRLQNLMELSGYNSLEQLEENDPELAQRLVNNWNQLKEDAFLKENDWHRDQDKEKKKFEDDKKRIDDEYTAVKSTANDRLKEAEKTYPELSKELKESGIDAMVDSISELTNVPQEYFLANEQFFNTFAKAAHAISIAKDMPNIQKNIKTKLEKEIFDTKENEGVASGDPLPRDNKVVANKFQRLGRGVSFDD